jgi:hypothetical protein
MPSPVKFTVTIPSQRAYSMTIEHCIEEAIRAFAGQNNRTNVVQLNDTTLEITITPLIDRVVQ